MKQHTYVCIWNVSIKILFVNKFSCTEDEIQVIKSQNSLVENVFGIMNIIDGPKDVLDWRFRVALKLGLAWSFMLIRRHACM